MVQLSKTCLYCQTENSGNSGDELCHHCGMALPEKHPNDRSIKVKFFVKAFWIIALFCLIMVLYLPR